MSVVEEQVKPEDIKKAEIAIYYEKELINYMIL